MMSFFPSILVCLVLWNPSQKCDSHLLHQTGRPGGVFDLHFSAWHAPIDMRLALH